MIASIGAGTGPPLRLAGLGEQAVRECDRLERRADVARAWVQEWGDGKAPPRQLTDGPAWPAPSRWDIVTGAILGASAVDDPTEPAPGRLLRLMRFPPVFLAVLYLGLTYLYLSGFFFRSSFAQGPWQGLAASAMACAMMLMAYAVQVRVVERRAVGELAVGAMGRELGLGLALGFGLYSACILVLMGFGAYRAEGLNAWAILLPGLAAPLATGVFEELLFRGGVFRIVEKWAGTWIALVVSSVVFGFVHLENDAATMRGILSISIWAGVLLAATYVLTRRLWLGIGLHAAWNYTQGTVWSGIVSGNEAPTAGLVRSAMQGPDWLTGGSFGVEASAVALLLCTAVGAAMMVMAVRRGTIVSPIWRRAR